MIQSLKRATKGLGDEKQIHSISPQNQFSFYVSPSSTQLFTRKDDNEPPKVGDTLTKADTSGDSLPNKGITSLPNLTISPSNSQPSSRPSSRPCSPPSSPIRRRLAERRLSRRLSRLRVEIKRNECHS
jgi:hypothetical protein